YILTDNDPFGAIDLDHCRCTITNSIDVWAQNYLQAAVNTYQEITPSGEGVRIWGIADGNRSDVFHAIVGHYAGCGWDVDRIVEHLQEHPQGIGSRYIAEDRLRPEIERSAKKFEKAELPLFDSWEAKAPPEPEQEPPPQQPPPADPEL